MVVGRFDGGWEVWWWLGGLVVVMGLAGEWWFVKG